MVGSSATWTPGIALEAPEVTDAGDRPGGPRAPHSRAGGPRADRGGHHLGHLVAGDRPGPQRPHSAPGPRRFGGGDALPCPHHYRRRRQKIFWGIGGGGPRCGGPGRIYLFRDNQALRKGAGLRPTEHPPNRIGGGLGDRPRQAPNAGSRQPPSPGPGPSPSPTPPPVTLAGWQGAGRSLRSYSPAAPPPAHQLGHHRGPGGDRRGHHLGHHRGPGGDRRGHQLGHHGAPDRGGVPPGPDRGCHGTPWHVRGLDGGQLGHLDAGDRPGGPGADRRGFWLSTVSTALARGRYRAAFR